MIKRATALIKTYIVGKYGIWEVFNHTSKFFNNNIEKIVRLQLELRRTIKYVYKIPTVTTFLLWSFGNFKPLRISKILKPNSRYYEELIWQQKW